MDAIGEQQLKQTQSGSSSRSGHNQRAVELKLKRMQSGSSSSGHRELLGAGLFQLDEWEDGS